VLPELRDHAGVDGRLRRDHLDEVSVTADLDLLPAARRAEDLDRGV
jgi:hypothetical protein